jgi:hypothetical protein
MKRVLLMSVLGAVACGSDAPSGPAPLPVAGTWSWSQFVQGGGAQCGEGGTLTLTQSGGRIEGSLSARGACETPSIAVDFLRNDSVTSGAVDGTRLRFTIGVCRYEGTVVGDPPTQGGGTATCNGLPGTTGELVGTWETRR